MESIVQMLQIPAVFVLLVSGAALVYPFRPYRRRSNALLAMLACGAILQQADKRDLASFDVASPAMTGVEDAAASAGSRLAIEVSPAGAAASIATTPEETEPEEAAPREAAASTRIVPPSTAAVLQGRVAAMEWEAALKMLTEFHALSLDLGPLRDELETQVAALVRPVPASNFELNLQGYMILQKLRPENTAYAAKVADYEGRIEARRRGAVAKLRKSEDRVSGTTFHQHPSAPKYLNSRSTAHFYIGESTSGYFYLRLKIQYTSSDWLFVEKVTAWREGSSRILHTGRFDRDNNTTIWEWVDINPSDAQIEILRDLATAPEAILRFEGMQYRRDVTLSAADKAAIIDVLTAYDVLTER